MHDLTNIFEFLLLFALFGALFTCRTVDHYNNTLFSGISESKKFGNQVSNQSLDGSLNLNLNNNAFVIRHSVDQSTQPLF